jgi:hypothetical protein
VPLAKSAIQYASAELEEIQALVADITQGEITSVRSPKMRQWVQDRVGEEALKLMWNGEKYSIDKTVRANLLALADENPDEVPQSSQIDFNNAQIGGDSNSGTANLYGEINGNEGIEAKARELGVLGTGYDSYDSLKQKCMRKLNIAVL